MGEHSFLDLKSYLALSSRTKGERAVKDVNPVGVCRVFKCIYELDVP